MDLEQPGTPADGPHDGPQVGASAPDDPEGGDRGGPPRGLLWALVGLVVLAAIGAALLLGDDEPVTATVACAPAPGTPGVAQAPDLQIEPNPEALPPAVLCAFDDDAPVDLASFLGGPPLVVNFWATWCAPCVAEMPEFEEFHLAAGDTVRLVGINTQDAPPLARDFAADLGITYDLVRDPQGDYFTATKGFGMPTTLFVQPDGTISFRHTGPLTLAQMADLVAEHLGVEVPVGA